MTCTHNFSLFFGGVAAEGNKSLPEQSGVGVDEKPSNRFGKEDVELEIQDEESLKNY